MVMVMVMDDSTGFATNWIISLHLKMENLSDVMDLWSLVLKVDDQNAISLFRIGLELKNLENLEGWFKDLKNATEFYYCNWWLECTKSILCFK